MVKQTLNLQIHVLNKFNKEINSDIKEANINIMRILDLFLK